jgi:hypothetical protein
LGERPVFGGGAPGSRFVMGLRPRGRWCGHHGRAAHRHQRKKRLSKYPQLAEARGLA